MREIRRDRFERQPLADIEAHNDRINARLAPLIYELAESKSVDHALKPYRRPRHNPLNVSCPYCRATVSRPCTSGSFTMRRYHPARLDPSGTEIRNRTRREEHNMINK